MIKTDTQGNQQVIAWAVCGVLVKKTGVRWWCIYDDDRGWDFFFVMGIVTSMVFFQLSWTREALIA